MIFNSLMSIGAGNIMVHCQFTFCIVCIYCYSDGSITLSMRGIYSKYVIMLFLAKQLKLKSTLLRLLIRKRISIVSAYTFQIDQYCNIQRMKQNILISLIRIIKKVFLKEYKNKLVYYNEYATVRYIIFVYCISCYLCFLLSFVNYEQ